MGMVIFESSGVFSPGRYGLSPGDLIQIVCVGGGAGGNGVSNQNYNQTFHPGGAGGASSFGSILSAAGGTIGAMQSQHSLVYEVATSHYYAGGPGQGGWLPGVGALYSFSPSVIVVDGAIISSAPSFDKGVTSWGGRCTSGGYGTAGNYMGVGSKGSAGSGQRSASGNYYYAVGVGGSGGYGASGPGGCLCNDQVNILGTYGGNAGNIKTSDYVITSMDEIAVTVGAGGGGGGGSGTAAGGAGAPGCVAIFW